mmetsp:Transcript_9683/g.35934  ORF Transcript_9683/g.35934 Transcript_9683/m.35934 type:complete len:2047 (-) Transcript_9683:63-6203(-)
MTDTSNISLNPFPYIQQPKNHTLQTDSKSWKQLNGLPSIEHFWKKKDPNVLEDYEATLAYIESLVLTENDIREYPTEVLKLFEVTQCLLEIKDTDAESAENLELDLQDSEAENDKLRRDLDTLQKEVDKQKADIQRLTNESQMHRQDKIHKRELEDKIAEVAEWKKRCHDKDTTLSNVNADLDESRRQLRDMENNYNKAQQKARLYKEEISTLTAMERKMRGRNVEDDQVIRDLEDKVERLKQEREEMKLELEETTDHVIQFKEDVNTAKKTENELRQQLKINQNEIVERTRDAEERSMALNNLQERMDSLKEEHENEIQQLRSQLEREMHDLQTQNSSLLKEIRSKEDKITLMSLQINVLQQNQKQKPATQAREGPTGRSSLDDRRDSVSSGVSDTEKYVAPVASYENEEDQSELVRELREEISSLKQRIQELSLRVEQEPATGDSTDNLDLGTTDMKEELETLRTAKIRLEDNVIHLQENMRDVEKELLWSKQKIKAYEDGQSGLEIAKRDIRYCKEQIVKREETIEKYKKLLNLYLNNIEDLRWILEGIYKDYNHPMEKRVNVKKMQDELHKNLLHMLMQEEKRRLATKHTDADYENIRQQLTQWKQTHQHSNDEYAHVLQQLEEQRRLKESQLSSPTENQSLRAEVVMLNEKLNAASSNVHQLRRQLQQMEKNSQARLTSSQLVPEPSEDVHQLKQQYNRLKSKHQITLSALESAQREKKALESRVESLQKEVEMGFDDRHKKDLTESQTQSAVARLEQKLHRHKKSEQALRDELGDVSQKNDALNAEIGRLKGIIQEFKDRPLNMPEVSATNHTASEQVSQLRSRLEQAERQIEALTIQYENGKNGHTKARKDLLASNNRIAALQRQCDELSHQAQLDERQIRMLREQIGQLNEQNTSALYSPNQRDGQSIVTNDTRSPQYIEAQKEIRNLQRQLDDAQDEIISLKHETEELRDISEGQKMREEEWKSIQERLKYHEETLQHDQKLEKKQAQQTMKQVVAGYNVVISQKDRTIEKYTAQLNALRQDILREKRKHEQELDDYKNMLKSQDSKLLKELRLQMNALETQPVAEPSPAQGMALEDVEELMAEKNRVIDQVSEENSLLHNRISDMENNQRTQFDNFYKMKRHLEEEIERQDKEIQQLQFELNNERSKPPKIVTQPGETKVITKTKKVVQKPSEDSQVMLSKTRADLLQERTKNDHLRQSIETLTQNLVDAQTALSRKQVYQEQDFETKVNKSVDLRTNQWKHAAKELKSEAGHLSAALDKKQKVLEALQEKYVEAQREIAAKEQVMNRQIETVSRLNRGQKRLQKELDELRKGGNMDMYAQEKIEDLEKRLRVLQQRQGTDTTNVKKEAEDIKMQYKHNREELVQQRKLNDQAEENLRNIERSHQRQIQKHLKKITHLEEERQHALDQRDEATLAVSQLKQKIKQLKVEHEQHMRDAQNKYKRGLQSAHKAERPNEVSPSKVEEPHTPTKDDVSVDKLLHEHRKEIQQLREKFDKETHQLRTDLNRMKTLAKQKDLKLQQLHAQNNSLSDAQQVSFKTDYASEISELRRKLSDYYSLKEELQSIMNQFEADRERHALEVKQLEERLVNANLDPEERKSSLDEELLAKRKETLDLRFEKEELKQRLITLETKLKDLELIQAVQQEIVNVAPTSSLAASRVIAPESQPAHQSQSGHGHKASRQELEKVIDAMKSVITKLQEDNEKLKKSAISNREYMDLMNKQKILKSKLAAKRKELEKFQKENEHQEDAREKLTKTLDQNVQLNKRLKREKEITAKHKKKEQALQADKQKLEDELQKIKDHMTSAHNAALARQKMLHEQRIKDLAEQKQKFKTKSEHLQGRVRDIEKEAEKSQVKMNDLQYKLDEERLQTQERIHGLEEQLEREKQKAAKKPRTTAVAVDASQDTELAEHEQSDDSDVQEESVPHSRMHQKEIEYYQQQMVNLKEQNDKLLARIQTMEAISSSGEKYLRRVRELETERDHLLQENKEQREELDQFDESFFEELEDLKYKYMEERRLNEEYKRQLGDLGVEVHHDGGK